MSAAEMGPTEMGTAVLTSRIEWNSAAATTLNAAVRCWFVAAVAGQWMFASYIALVYGGAAARGNLQAWTSRLAHGYEAGNTVGNTALLTHLLFAAAISFMGALQLIPRIRTRFPVFHRWNGRIYIVVAFIMGVTALYLMLSGRKLVGDLAQHVAVEINAVLIIVFAAMAWRTAVARRFNDHRRWALRLFLVVGGVWFFRVGLFFWLVVNRGPAGFDPKTFIGPAITFLSFGQYLLPLAVLELYLRAQERGGVPGRMAMASGLCVLTLAMSVGILAATLGLWLPRIKSATTGGTPTRHHAPARRPASRANGSVRWSAGETPALRPTLPRRES